MKNSSVGSSLLAYTTVHFMVDFVCFYYLMGTFSRLESTGIGTAKGFLLYNAIAFGLQFLIGWCFDGNKYTYAGMIGLLLLITGIGMNTLLPMLCKDALVMERERILEISYNAWLVIILALLALGNAFFHVAGGMDSLLYSNGKMKRCGIFVSSGALGVAMGSYAGEQRLLNGISVLCILFVGMGLLVLYGEPGRDRIPVKQGEKREDPKMLLPALLCFGAIVLRGYLGTVWSVSFSVLFMGAIATCFGKAVGGFLADAFGGKETALVCMGIAAFCFSGVVNGPLAAMLGIVCFNATMPITYYTLYESFCSHPGFACGLNCLGLVIGVSVSCFVSNAAYNTRLILVVGMLLTAVFVYYSAPAKAKGERNR